MAKKRKHLPRNHPKFRKGQLVMVFNDITGEVDVPSFVEGIEGHSKDGGWRYSIRGYPFYHVLDECQMRRIKKREIR